MSQQQAQFEEEFHDGPAYQAHFLVTQISCL